MVPQEETPAIISGICPPAQPASGELSCERSVPSEVVDLLSMPYLRFLLLFLKCYPLEEAEEGPSSAPF